MNVVCRLLISILLLQAYACNTVDVFEKNIAIPGKSWERSFKPSVDFSIKDTLSLYNVYVTLRHTHAYSYNNIWLNLSYQMPGDSVKHQRVDILLADNQKGWLGTGMDDIYTTWRQVNAQPVQFKMPGNVNFTIEQIMRDNPLKNVINAGIRVEKVDR
ncbi:MAG: gliding motility lipoprotein GldH [Chitinophagaceae bacterium]|nr:gliding motility lipoprotein GldH [Chitinophagaceae bacterium]